MNKKDIYVKFHSFSNFSELPVTSKEKSFARNLSPRKKDEYIYARAKTRLFLSSIFDLKPLEVPLDAPPNKPPLLGSGLGCVSISHCERGLLIGWSRYSIGVDVEPINRKSPALKIVNRFFSENEKNELMKFSGESLREKFLELWVVKEAAIKSVGGSVLKDLNKWELNDKNFFVSNESLNLQRRISIKEIKEFKMAIAYDMKIEKGSLIFLNN